MKICNFILVHTMTTSLPHYFSIGGSFQGSLFPFKFLDILIVYLRVLPKVPLLLFETSAL
jgi:hypothetical protein